MYQQFLLSLLRLLQLCNRLVEVVVLVLLPRLRARRVQLILRQAVLLRARAYGFPLLVKREQREARRPMVP
jgi:hypothetical protein